MDLVNKLFNNNAILSQSTAQLREFMRNDFPSIKKATIVFCLCISFGGTLVIGSQFLLENQLDMINNLQQLENKTLASFNHASQNKRQILAYQPRYVQLVSKGFVGVEKRLDWIEHIQRIQNNALLLPMEYEILEQQQFQVDPTIDTGNLEVRGSKMVVKMNLLHEMDMIHFFEGLKTSQVMDMQSCHVERLPQAVANMNAPRLTAECALYWITIGKRDTNQNSNLPIATIQ